MCVHICALWHWRKGNYIHTPSQAHEYAINELLCVDGDHARVLDGTGVEGCWCNAALDWIYIDYIFLYSDEEL